MSGIGARPVKDGSLPASGGSIGGNEEARDVDGAVGVVESADPAPATDRGRSRRVPGRAGTGAVTPGRISNGRLEAVAAWAGLVAGLVLEVETEPEPEAERGCGAERIGAVPGGSRAGGDSGGAWSWAAAKLAQKTSPENPPAKTPLVIATLASRTVLADNKNQSHLESSAGRTRFAAFFSVDDLIRRCQVASERHD